MHTLNWLIIDDLVTFSDLFFDFFQFWAQLISLNLSGLLLLFKTIILLWNRFQLVLILGLFVFFVFYELGYLSSFLIILILSLGELGLYCRQSALVLSNLSFLSCSLSQCCLLRPQSINNQLFSLKFCFPSLLFYLNFLFLLDFNLGFL